MQSCPFCLEKLQQLRGLFYRCGRCDLIYNGGAQPLEYEQDYFDKEYKAQYGRSYIEDAPFLRERGAYRLEKAFRDVSVPDKSSLLEIGSAAGFFLEEAVDRGFEVEGWEISKAMAHEANLRGLKTRRGDFFNLYRDWLERGGAPFFSVAAGYVWEHFADQVAFWGALKRLCAPGGYLLLAMPSWRGPVYYFNRSEWYRNHPKDHFVDYSPRAVREVGRRFGFSVVGAHSEGIHPGRFPLGTLPLIRPLYKLLQNRHPISDTIFMVLEYVN